MNKLSKETAVLTLKTSVFIYDDIISWMESNGGWLDCRAELIDLFVLQKIKWWEFYQNKELFTKLAIIAMTNMSNEADLSKMMPGSENSIELPKMGNAKAILPENSVPAPAPS